MEFPEDLYYTSDHEWVGLEDGRVKVGITDYAQDALGDVVFVELPQIGKKVDSGAVLCELESTKSVSEVYAPVSGTVREVNTLLESNPEYINQDPYGQGWLCILDVYSAEIDKLAPQGRLLDKEHYRELVSSESVHDDASGNGAE
ncbi:MAG: glycine cleavage system protein GcvH [Actinobacteria bacterium]|nr:glycine cleavage system protein GcvH [Actinomycetota bacterium]MCL6104105.1 glycine cleavage system protein GcvH [Actinomycetota bacterium]